MKKVFLSLMGILYFGYANAQIPLEQCWDGYIRAVGSCPSQPVPQVWGGIAIDPSTREYGGVWNYSDGNEAMEAARINCNQRSQSERCIGFAASYYYIAVAVSTDDAVVEFDGANTIKDAEKLALKKCNKAGGNDCEVVMIGYNDKEPDVYRWGALAYNPATKDYGYSWSKYTRREAVEGALQSCGDQCVAYGFQERYASMAMSPDEKLIVGVGGKLEEADSRALKLCRKTYKVDECTIVLQGNAFKNIADK